MYDNVEEVRFDYSTDKFEGQLFFNFSAGPFLSHPEYSPGLNYNECWFIMKI